ncbi:MAG TPA: PilZ domain-containing protein [Terriglobia bacterium]|nr:PilZ domain-containing protein [Terriglobia bacterium]
MDPKLQTDEKSDAAAFLKRRSDRVSIEVPIEVAGSDFLDQTRAVLVSRHGGKIVLNRILSADQELTVLCKTTGKEAAARVVGHLGEGPEGHYYGIAFLEPDVNLWDIEFPEPSESEKAAARVLLECAVCHARKVTYLDGPEAEVLEANHRLSVFCKHCSNATLWLPALASAAPHDSGVEQPSVTAERPQVPDQAVRTRENRREARLRLRVMACIRDEQLGEEITKTENISRSGFCFKSRKEYRVGSVLQAALPYAPNQANIFSPGRVAHAEESTEAGVFSYGVSYILASRWGPST